MLVNLIGWTGSILFSLCAIPQAYTTWKVGNAEGLSWWFLLLWLVGEVLTLLYILLTSRDLPLITNYVLNMSCLFVILRYKCWPRGGD